MLERAIKYRIVELITTTFYKLATPVQKISPALSVHTTRN